MLPATSFRFNDIQARSFCLLWESLFFVPTHGLHTSRSDHSCISRHIQSFIHKRSVHPVDSSTSTSEKSHPCKHTVLLFRSLIFHTRAKVLVVHNLLFQCLLRLGISFGKRSLLGTFLDFFVFFLTNEFFRVHYHTDYQLL